MKPRPIVSTSGRSNAGAGAAGAGGGTLIAIVANSLPDGSLAKTILVVSAPTVAVLLGALWIWAQAELVTYWRRRKTEVVLSRTIDTLQTALRNPETSEAHKRALRKKLEAIELVRANHQLAYLETLTGSMTQSAPNLRTDVQVSGAPTDVR
jgi:hypothetical protein